MWVCMNSKSRNAMHHDEKEMTWRTYLVGSRGAGSNSPLPVSLVDEHGSEVSDLRPKLEYW
jgi:hypothetical protein